MGPLPWYESVRPEFRSAQFRLNWKHSEEQHAARDAKGKGGKKSNFPPIRPEPPQPPQPPQQPPQQPAQQPAQPSQGGKGSMKPPEPKLPPITMRTERPGYSVNVLPEDDNITQFLTLLNDEEWLQQQKAEEKMLELAEDVAQKKLKYETLRFEQLQVMQRLKDDVEKIQSEVDIMSQIIMELGDGAQKVVAYNTEKLKEQAAAHAQEQAVTALRTLQGLGYTAESISQMLCGSDPGQMLCQFFGGNLQQAMAQPVVPPPAEAAEAVEEAKEEAEPEEPQESPTEAPTAPADGEAGSEPKKPKTEH